VAVQEITWDKERVHQLFIDFVKAYNSVRRDVLYSILTEFGVPMKIVMILEMHLNGMYNKVCTGKNLSDAFLIQHGLKQGNGLSSLCFRICHQKCPRQ
jgi:hypothetical protein